MATGFEQVGTAGTVKSRPPKLDESGLEAGLFFGPQRLWNLVAFTVFEGDEVTGTGMPWVTLEELLEHSAVRQRVAMKVRNPIYPRAGDLTDRFDVRNRHRNRSVERLGGTTG